MNKIKDVFNELEKRNIIKDITNKDKIELLNSNDGIYIGFDPTAESLHLGNYVAISVLKRFQTAGIKAFAVLGGATGMIGDPSFKESERNFLDHETLQKNKDAIKEQLSSFGFRVIDNYEFYKDMNVLDFLRNVGKEININYMINKDCISSRLDTGISFTEFTYTLIQGYDFLKLYNEFGIKVQAGGSDQWGNITTGLEMIRKSTANPNALGFTMQLLTDNHGKKFGKSEGNAIWLDKNMCSPFKMYQFFLNQPDSEVEKLLLWLTSLKRDDITSLINKHFIDPKQKIAQKKLAWEVVNDIHGMQDANNAKLFTELLFSYDKPITSLDEKQVQELEKDLPVFIVDENELLIDILVNNKISISKREAREFLKSNSILVDNTICNDENQKILPKFFNNKYAFIKKGKKNFYILKFKHEFK